MDGYLEKRKEYTKKLYTLGDRNSYSKTDPDATFMRMKEDAMRNGQLKPAYNIQHGVDSEYITWIDISPRPTDTCTLIPFLKDMESHLGFKYSEIVADAGYESEENYLFIEGNGQTAYIKPQNYEISKTRKYKKDISRRENMEYHADRDSYICRNGRELTVTNERRSKTASGYVSVKTYYRSPDCTGCPYKTECIKGNNCKTPMEKRNKVLMVSKTMSQKRAEDLERITSEYGTMLRMNRSIQAEGSFADSQFPPIAADVTVPVCMVLHVFPSTDVFFVFLGLRNLIVLRLYIGGLSVFLNEKIVLFTFVPGICNVF